MSETYALMRVITDSTKTVRRIRRYLDEDARPASAEKIVKEDTIDFEDLDLLEAPIEMKGKGNRLDAWFEFIDEDQLWDICQVIQGVNGFVTGYAMFADDEEYRVYYKCQGKKMVPIYRIEDDPELDEKLWELEWDVEAMDLIIEQRG